MSTALLARGERGKKGGGVKGDRVVSRPDIISASFSCLLSFLLIMHFSTPNLLFNFIFLLFCVRAQYSELGIVDSKCERGFAQRCVNRSGDKFGYSSNLHITSSVAGLLPSLSVQERVWMGVGRRSTNWRICAWTQSMLPVAGWGVGKQ